MSRPLLHPDPARPNHRSRRSSSNRNLGPGPAHHLSNPQLAVRPYKPELLQLPDTSTGNATFPAPSKQLPGSMAAAPGNRARPARISRSRITELIQLSSNTHDLASIVDLHGWKFNEVHIMCAVSRLSNILRLGPAAPNPGGTSSPSPQAVPPPSPLDPHPSAQYPGLTAATPLLEQLLSLSTPLIDSFTPRQLVAILSSLARTLNLPSQLHASPLGPHGPGPADRALGQASRAAVQRMVSRGAAVMHELDADQGCHLLWAAAKLECPDRDLLVSAATCMLRGSWRAGGSGGIGGGAASYLGAAADSDACWPMPYQLTPMLLWSVAHGTASQLREPAVQQLLQLLLDPAGPPGSLFNPRCLTSLPLEGLVTCLYSIALLHKTRGAAGRGSELMDADLSAAGAAAAAATGIADCEPLQATPALVAPPALDTLCDSILHSRRHSSSSSSSSGDGSSSAWTTPQSATNMLWALSHLKHRHAPLLALLTSETARLLHESTKEAMAPPRSSRGRPPPRAYTNQELCNTVLSMATLQLRSAALMRGVVQWLRAHARGLAARDAGELLYALAVLQQQQGLHAPAPRRSRLQGVAAGAAAPEPPLGRAPAPFLPADVMRLLSAAAERHLAAFSPSHVAGLLWDLTCLGCMPPGVAAAAAESLRQQVPGATAAQTPAAGAGHERGLLLPLAELEPEDLSRLCRVLSAPAGLELSGSARGPVLDLVAAEATEWCPSMSDEELVIVLESFARLRHPCPGLLEAASGHAQARLARMAPHRLVRLVCSLAGLEAVCKGMGSMAGLAARDLLQQAASGPLVACLGALSGREMVKLARAYAASEVQPGKQLLGSLAAALCAQAPRVAPDRLSTVCWALSRLDAPMESLQQLAGVALQMLQAQEQKLHAQAGLPPPPQRPNVPSAAALVQPRTLSATAISLAQRSCLPPALLSAILRASVRVLAGFGAAEAAQLLWAVSVSSAPGAARQEARLLELVAALVGIVVRDLQQSQSRVEAEAGTEDTSTTYPSSSSSSSGSHVAADAGAAAQPSGPSPSSTRIPSSSEPQPRPRGGSSGVPTGALCLFLSACATLEFHPGEQALQEAARQLLPHVPLLSSKTLCQLQWSMAVLRLGSSQAHEAAAVPAIALASPAARERVPGMSARRQRPAVAVVPRTKLGAPGEGVSGALLLGAVREVLTRRLCVEQLEVLSLGHAVRLAWALACRHELWWSTRTDVALAKRRKQATRALRAKDGGAGIRVKRRRRQQQRERWPASVLRKHTAPRLLIHLAARAFSSPPEALDGLPLLQRQLLELRLLLRAECQPRSSWRALSRRWQLRAGKGGGEAGSLQPPDVRQRDQQCASQVSACLQRLGLAAGSRWAPITPGDAVCLFKAWPEELEDAGPQAGAVGEQGATTAAAARARARNSPVKFAVYMLSSYHLSCDAAHRELASSEIRGRLLHQQGFKVLALSVAGWMGLSRSEQDTALRAALWQCMVAEGSLEEPKLQVLP